MVKKKKKEKKTWGDVYNHYVLKGYDNGYAAWLADQFEKRQLKL